MTTCPKCQFERVLPDGQPEDVCPKCLVIYEKAVRAMQRQKESAVVSFSEQLPSQYKESRQSESFIPIISSSSYYVESSGEVHWKDLKELALDKSIKPETMVFVGRISKWVKANKIPTLFDSRYADQESEEHKTVTYNTNEDIIILGNVEINSVLTSKNNIKLLNSSLTTSIESTTGIQYFGGSKKVDNKLKDRGYNSANCSGMVNFYQDALVFEVHHLFSSLKFCILTNDIKNWTIFKNNDGMTIEEPKSVVGRAAVGGVLLGPLGALLGGMTGVGSKDTNLSGIDYFLSMSCSDGTRELDIIFSVKKKYLKKIYNLFIKHFKEKYIEQSKPSQKKETEKKLSLLDELQKLHGLLKDGAINDAEYNMLKEKLLKSKGNQSTP